MKLSTESRSGGRRTSGRAPRGYTLIELMVTMAVFAIIASIAYPSYRQFVLKSNRTDAVRTLTSNAQILQRCYSQYFAFNNAACPAVLAIASPNGYYTINNAAVTASTYTLVAKPAGVQADDTTCAQFTLDQTGNETAVDTGGNNQATTCWGSN
jgi:type IV pilus assembly protein PilE